MIRIAKNDAGYLFTCLRLPNARDGSQLENARRILQRKETLAPRWRRISALSTREIDK